MRIWLRDRPARRHLFGLILLVGGFCISLAAQGQNLQQVTQIEKPSLLDRWLSPDVIIGGAVFLLYVGELRGDIGRIKAELKALKDFKEALHDALEHKYMSREVVDARLRAIERRIE